jgi:hypothetical protein
MVTYETRGEVEDVNKRKRQDQLDQLPFQPRPGCQVADDSHYAHLSGSNQQRAFEAVRREQRLQ